MVCYHEIIHTDGPDTHFTLVHSEDFEGYEGAGTVEDLVPIGNKILETTQYCSEYLLDLLENNYREIHL